ncbi:hypothetical protein FACS1894181_10060 [Bacteroidia bacterium]|nr:hypothetical protein FACS1894181_10060 [Bacteroidia bacterium]
MDSKPLPDFSHTDSTQVDLRLKAEILDGAFYLFLNEIQGSRQDKLNVFDLLILDKIRQGISTGLYEASVVKLQRDGLIKSQSSADRKYVLGNRYYEIARQPAYIKEYRVRDLQIVAGCFQQAKDVSMKNFVDAFDNQLTREQIKTLVYKLESKGLVITNGIGRWTTYQLSEKIDDTQDMLKQFQSHIGG